MIRHWLHYNLGLRCGTHDHNSAPVSLLPLDFEPSHKIELGQQDLENVAMLYTMIKNLRGSMSDSEDIRMTDAFDRHLQKVIDELNLKLAGITDPYLRQGEVLMAKHRLYELCFEKSVEHAQKAQPEFGAVLRQLRETHRRLFDDFPKILRDVSWRWGERVERERERERERDGGRQGTGLETHTDTAHTLNRCDQSTSRA